MAPSFDCTTSPERDHHPFAHGPLEYSRAAAAIDAGQACGETLDAQAKAYAASYLRRKSEASGSSAPHRVRVMEGKPVQRIGF